MLASQNKLSRSSKQILVSLMLSHFKHTRCYMPVMINSKRNNFSPFNFSSLSKQSVRFGMLMCFGMVMCFGGSARRKLAFDQEEQKRRNAGDLWINFRRLWMNLNNLNTSRIIESARINQQLHHSTKHQLSLCVQTLTTSST